MTGRGDFSGAKARSAAQNDGQMKRFFGSKGKKRGSEWRERQRNTDTSERKALAGGMSGEKQFLFIYE